MVTPVSCPGPVSPGHADLRHVLAAGPQGCLEHDGTLSLCLCGHGHHVGKELGGQCSCPHPSPGGRDKRVWAPRRPRLWDKSLARHSGHVSAAGPESCTSVEDCRGHPRGPHTASCPGPGPDICQVLVPLGPLQAVTPTVPLSRPTGPLGAVAAACCANAHGMVLSRCTAAGTGATATPPPGSAGSSTSCPASRWLLWPLPSIPP